MRFRSKSQSPEHWSKDFVEHLRTVHFALIALSIGLILLLSSKPYDARVALTQVDEILQFQSRWSPSGLGGSLPATGGPVGDLSRTFVNIGPDVSAEVTIDDRFPTDRAAVPKHLNFHMNQLSIEWWCPTDGKADASALRTQFGNFPDTVAEFRKWWNVLRSPFELFVVNSVFEEGVIVNRGLVYVGKAHVSTSVNLTAGQRIMLTPRFISCFPSLTFDLGADLDANYKVFFKPAVVTRIELSQKAVHGRFHDWKLGNFDDAFSDLAKAAHGREDLDWRTLERLISDDTSKSSDTFEAFGMKFPAEQVTRWGIILLLGVQLYLFMYLKRLSNKLHPDDPGWEMPWVAMDESALARSILFFTLVLLPSCAALLVTSQGLVQLAPEGASWHILTLLKAVSRASKIEMTMVLLALVASITLSILSWKYRPQLRERVSSPQLFE